MQLKNSLPAIKCFRDYYIEWAANIRVNQKTGNYVMVTNKLHKTVEILGDDL